MTVLTQNNFVEARHPLQIANLIFSANHAVPASIMTVLNTDHKAFTEEDGQSKLWDRRTCKMTRESTESNSATSWYRGISSE